MSWRTRHEQWRLERPLARAMRKEATPAESALWRRLRQRQLLGLRFLRQYVIGRFIADFYCAEKRMVIEVDGEIHLRRIERDAARTRALESIGLVVLRFTNAEVLTTLDDVLHRIARAAPP